MRLQEGEETTLEASSHSPALTRFNHALFPLPVLSPPRTTRNAGHRRRSHQRALAIYTVANSMVRALNTIFLNYPSAHAARALGSADPSLAQSRLMASLLDVAAAHCKASRQWRDSSAGGIGLTNTEGGCVTPLIPGCTRSARRRARRLINTSSHSVGNSTSDQGVSLFVFDPSTPAGLDSVNAAAPDRHAAQHHFTSQQSVIEAIDAGFKLLDSLPPVAEHETGFSYTGGPLPTGLVSLVSERVALPSSLNNIPLVSLLPASVASLYSNPAVLLLPPEAARENHIEARLRKPRVLAECGEYVALIRRMLHLGMLTLTTTPSCVNGLFGVPKGDQIRLILDARPANCYFVAPPRVRLPSPSHLASLRLTEDQPLYVAKLELSNFYHQLTLPQWMQPYFALPALNHDELLSLGLVDCSDDVRAAIAAGGRVHPCCTTLPMGFSHSVFIAQCVHEHVMYRDELLRPSDNIVCLTSPLIDRPLHALYIDDNILLGTDYDELNQLFNRISDAYVRAMLPPNDSKRVRPTLDVVTTLGVDIDGRRGVIFLSPSKQHAIISATQRLLTRHSATGLELSAVVGSWTWPMLLRRPALAAFKHVYKFAQLYGDQYHTLWPCVRRELLVVMSLTPLLRCDLRRRSWSKLMATDASSTGSGVVSTELTAQMESVLWPVITQSDCTLLQEIVQPRQSDQSSLVKQRPTLQAQQPAEVYRASALHTEYRSKAVKDLITSPSLCWSTVIASRWCRTQHINELELLSLLFSLRWALSHPDSIGRQLHILVDSTSVYFGVNKGRSSSPRMLALLRRYAALTLASRASVLTGWVPSALNPADQASRKYLKRRHCDLNG